MWKNKFSFLFQALARELEAKNRIIAELEEALKENGGASLQQIEADFERMAQELTLQRERQQQLEEENEKVSGIIAVN